jgi:hypothetical protein
MTLHIFRCSQDDTFFGATDDPTGAKLPPNACAKGTWQFLKTQERSAIGFDSEEAKKQIQQQGYYLFRVEIKTTTTDSKLPPKS